MDIQEAEKSWVQGEGYVCLGISQTHRNSLYYPHMSKYNVHFNS